MSAPSMAYETWERTVLMVHGPCAFTPAEWTRYAERCAQNDYVGVIVLADPLCPGPNAKQRAESTRVWKARSAPPLVSVVTQSAVHRGMVTVMNWLQHGNVAAYHPSRLVEALQFARVAPAAQHGALEQLHALASRVESRWSVDALQRQLDALSNAA
jgi:hypothetical protein